MPEPATCGRRPVWTMQEILHAIFYVLRGGIGWRLIPRDLPPRCTKYGYFGRWRDAGLFGRINHHLVMADRARVGREASPSAVALDSQSVTTTDSGGPRGYDAGQNAKGRKRQALADTYERALILDPQPADVQDRDGAVPVLRLSLRTFPFITKAFADAGYAGDRPATVTIITVEIVRKPRGQVGFAVHPRRWVVEASSLGSAAIAAFSTIRRKRSPNIHLQPSRDTLVEDIQVATRPPDTFGYTNGYKSVTREVQKPKVV